MHLTNCENPVEITLHGERRKVPCGKCDYCRTVRKTAMAERINMEMRNHKFGIFFTLTYAEINLPKFVYDVRYNGFYVPNSDDDLTRFGLHGCDDCGLYVATPYISEGSRSIITSYMDRLGFVPFLRKKDIQDFVKRVRIKIDRNKELQNENKESLQITYAICGEYGPTTFKPHSHGLFLFDSEKLAKVLPQIIHEAWPFGSSRCRFTEYNEKSDYVAKYINSINHLPNIYRSKEFCPFLLVSKSHPIGFCAFSEEEIQKVATSGSYEVLREDVRTGERIAMPCPTQVERWLFPKFRAVDRIDSRLRTRLLELSMQQTSYKEFFALILDQSYNNNFFALNSNFYDSLTYKFDSSIADYFWLSFKENLVDPGRVPYSRISSVISDLYYAGLKARYVMNKYCINSIDEYYRIYDLYYYNKAIYKLSKQMELEEYVMTHQPEYLKYIDLDCFNSEVLESFEFKPVLDRIKYNIEHSHKNRRKNEYLAKHPELCPRLDNFSQGF